MPLSQHFGAAMINSQQVLLVVNWPPPGSTATLAGILPTLLAQRRMTYVFAGFIGMPLGRTLCIRKP